MNKYIFMIMLIMGTMTSISSYSWFGMWMGLEINLLSFIPLMKNNNDISNESMIKYFIIQSLASMILLLSIISFNYYNLMMNCALLTKLGAAPFHFWFTQVMESLNWFNAFLLLTWQKIAPLIMMTYNIQMNLFILIIIFNMIISGMMSFNQNSLRMILTYSSINHIGWMISSLMFKKLILLNYFSIYAISNLMIIYFFNKMNFYMKFQLSSKIMKNLLKIFLMMNFMNLGGIPPFIGFYPKWLIMNNLMENSMMMLMFVMIMLTLLMLFIYMNLLLSNFMLSSNKFIFNMKITNMFWFYWSNFLFLNSLLTMILLMNFL
uniref:NADH-ubiquinone oxidoreductase chain 2 n=1 Tax=Ptiliidae sp. BMNH 1274724 TaxID=1796537 RepID=A0A126TGD4_9COLE|nr:NADH dehydrogenase subunit 2 [Ptiliidae sp. BMNH 1274724]